MENLENGNDLIVSVVIEIKRLLEKQGRQTQHSSTMYAFRHTKSIGTKYLADKYGNSLHKITEKKLSGGEAVEYFAVVIDVDSENDL